MNDKTSSATMIDDSGSDFEAAKTVWSALQPYDIHVRRRVLRWVGEKLGESASEKDDAVPGNMPTEPVPAVSVRAPDIKSYIAANRPKTKLQFVVLVADWCQFKAPEAQRLMSINMHVLQEASRLCGRERLINPRSLLHNASKAGLLNALGGGEFEINAVGENVVVDLGKVVAT